MATKLLRHDATLSHIRRYLGHVSDRMAEHCAKVAVSEIEDILQHVWVAGPGAPHPGELLSNGVEPMNRLDAEALRHPAWRAAIGVRDSKDPDGPVLAVSAGHWSTFLHGVAAGDFDR